MQRDWKFWAAVAVGGLLGANFVGGWIPEQYVTYLVGLLATLGISGYYVPPRRDPLPPPPPDNPFAGH